MVHIRKGTSKDCEGLLTLIKELATFEKAPDEVEVTTAELQQDFSNNVFDFFVATFDDEIVGIALYFIKYSTWKGKCIYLDDIVVKESLRSQGIGKLLFDEIVREGKKIGVRKIDWQVLNWNERAIKFYKQFNTTFDNEWLNCKLTKKEINEYIFGK